MSKNLIVENDEFQKRCHHHECPAYTVVYRFLLGARATAKFDAVDFSVPLVHGAYHKSAIYFYRHKNQYQLTGASTPTHNKFIFQSHLATLQYNFVLSAPYSLIEQSIVEKWVPIQTKGLPPYTAFANFSERLSVN